MRVLYNMPVPTTVQLWDGQRNVLQKYTAAGWSGGDAAHRYQKTIHSDIGQCIILISRI